MYLGLFIVFVLGVSLGYIFKIKGSEQKKNVDLSRSNETLNEETTLETDKEESLQKLVEEHNKAIVNEFEKMRMSASSLKRVEVTEEVEYDEAIFI